jgi:hypothetical protein
VHDRARAGVVGSVRAVIHALSGCNAGATPTGRRVVTNRRRDGQRQRSGGACRSAAATAAPVDLDRAREWSAAGLAARVANDDVVGPAGPGGLLLCVAGATVPDALAERHEGSFLRSSRTAPRRLQRWCRRQRRAWTRPCADAPRAGWAIHCRLRERVYRWTHA